MFLLEKKLKIDLDFLIKPSPLKTLGIKKKTLKYNLKKNQFKTPQPYNDPQPSTLNPQPSTDPQPSTLNPTTLH